MVASIGLPSIGPVSGRLPAPLKEFRTELYHLPIADGDR